MIRRLAIPLAAVLVCLPVTVAHADPTEQPVDPSTAQNFPVLSIDGEARTLTFPVANLDGSMVEDGRTITLKADVFFAYNKATLNATAGSALQQAAAKLEELGATKVKVAGHTDSKGSASYNRGLSQRRAEAVRKALLERMPQLNVTAQGYGESKPVATNKTGKGRALNRRVVITVTE